MSRHKTADLSGPYLDAAVAMAERLGNVSVQLRPFMIDPKGALRAIYVDDDGREQFVPGYSTDWGSGGYIIERERIDLNTTVDGWEAFDSIEAKYAGPTPLIAAMRAWVQSKLGDEVEIAGYTP
jgi:hypothetical protein